MGRKKATSYDVARLAGVSQSAVSRTFSPKGIASKATREKVLAAAKELQFRPNALAQSLSMGRSQLAGFVVTQYAQQNYPTVLKSAVDIMAEGGDSLLLQIADASDQGDQAIARLLDRQVDTILCATGLSDAAAHLCSEAGVPLVMINRKLNVEGVDHVLSDPRDAMRHIAQGLSASGARNIVFLDGSHESWIASARRDAFLTAWAQLEESAPKIKSGGFEYEGGYRSILELRSELTQIDAVVSANDNMAIGAIDALVFELGLSVPEDLQVVGYDDTPVARLRPYKLTTVDQDMRAMISAASHLAALRLGEFTRPSATIMTPGRVVLRGTTRFELPSANPT